jgi:zinc protease
MFSRIAMRAMKAMMAALFCAPMYAQAPSPAKTSAPAALPDAREIINRHVKAIGGRAAVLGIKSIHGTGTLAVPSNGMTGTIDLYSAAPNLQSIKITVQGIGEIQDGFDGRHGWSLSAITGPMLKVGKELDQAKLDADFFSELRDPKTYPTVKTLEKVTFDGRPCYKVSLSRIDGANDIDYYDVATGLRAGSEGTRETPIGPISQTTIERDYKKFGPLMQATAMTQKANGVEQKITLASVEYDTVDPSVFEPPPPIKALLK